jgi:hypothetical protein
MRDGLAPAYRERLREAQIDAAADAIAEANLQALAKADQLSNLFDRLNELVGDALTTPAEADRAACERRASARDILLAGRKGSVLGAVLALAKLAGNIQVQNRKALGADDPPMQVPLATLDDGSVQSAGLSTSPMLDYSQLTTAELEVLMSAAQIFERWKERPPAIVPPGDPEVARPRAAAAQSNRATEGNALDRAAELNPHASDAGGSQRSPAQARHILGKADGSWASPPVALNSNRPSNETTRLGRAEAATRTVTPRRPPTQRAP